MDAPESAGLGPAGARQLSEEDDDERASIGDAAGNGTQPAGEAPDGDSKSYAGYLFEGISSYPAFRHCLTTVMKLEELIDFYRRKFFSGFYDG